MNRNVIQNTLSLLALSGITFFGGVAQADNARLSLNVGGCCMPVAGHWGVHPHPVSWHGGHHHHHVFDPRSVFEQRQQHQRQRIVQGIRSGELTPHEASHLRHELRENRHRERAYWADDGRLSADEWRRLNHEQNAASRNIWRQKHDYQYRY